MCCCDSDVNALLTFASCMRFNQAFFDNDFTRIYEQDGEQDPTFGWLSYLFRMVHGSS